MRLLPLALLVSAAGVGPSYLPLEAGNRWVYAKSCRGQNQGEVTVEAKALPEEKGASRFALAGRLIMDDSSFANLVCWTDERGVWIRRTEKKAPADEAILLLKLPAKVGETWTVEVKDWEGKAKVDWKFEIAAEAKIHVPAGDFDTLRVRWTVETGLFLDMWFAPGTGIVRQEVTEGNHKEGMLELKSFTPAGK